MLGESSWQRKREKAEKKMKSSGTEQSLFQPPLPFVILLQNQKGGWTDRRVPPHLLTHAMLTLRW